ncbi:zinc ABC transporter ATP-binding protein ZnuC [Gynuella sp.]|uniref:zinc ABC transporter ATP-binding protein ZnuC n=1 Tax=Gynuella sp. TaxID=2969146 RepID=UPI003D1424DE
MTTLIKASGLGFSRQGKQILENIHVTLEKSSLVTLIGPNGAGKSTLVKILLGILSPDSGQIERSPGLKIGYMPQKLHIDNTMPLTVSRFLSLPQKQSVQRIEQVLSMTGVVHLANQYVQKLSGGEMQRVLLSRALINNPDLLVLDEPVQGVDFTGEVALYELIQRIRDELGCGILMVSHDLHIVMAKTDQVLCLNRHLCCSGEPETVSQHPEFRQLFGHHSSIGIYTHHHDHHHHLSEQG